MNLNSNEFLALDTVFSTMMDEGSKMDMVNEVKSGTRVDGEGFGEADVETIAHRLGVSVNAAKGYVGSLEKKGLVDCDPEDGMILITNDGILEWNKR